MLVSSAMRIRHLHSVRLAAIVMGTAVLTAASISSAAAQSGPYSDVPDDAYYTTPVVELDKAGVFDGTLCQPGEFCPKEPIDRKTMAVWTVRILDGQDPAEGTVSRFDDVDCCLPPFYPPFIERLAELGITRGCGDGSGFCPNQNTTRAHMAAFLSRAFNLSDGPDPGFSDVPVDAWYAEDAARLAASGISRGCGDGTMFCPDRILTRAEMATFLYRAIPPNGPPSSVIARPGVVDEGPGFVSASQTDLKDFEISVYYCGDDSSYNLSSRVAELNSLVNDFFIRESGGVSNVRFLDGPNGALITGLGVQWDASTTTLRHWFLRVNNSSWRDPCRAEAVRRAGHQKVLVLADVATGPGPDGLYTGGYAPVTLGGGAAIATLERHLSDIPGYSDKDLFFGIVAHEIGHGYYRWNHTFEDYNEQDETREMEESIMSYIERDSITGIVSGAKQNLNAEASESVRAYVACYHRKARGWVEKTASAEECAARAAQPRSPTVTVAPGDALLDLSWSVSDDGGEPIIEYHLWYRTSGNDEWIKVTRRSPEATLTELANGTTYQVAVRARNRIGVGEWSNIVEATPGIQSTKSVILTVGESVRDNADCTGTVATGYMSTSKVSMQAPILWYAPIMV